MNKKYSLLSLFFALTVLVAILLQSFHSFHHYEKFISEKHCHHKYAVNKTEINHSHQDFDHCFVCEFAFSNYTSNYFYSFSFNKVIVQTSYSFCYSKEITQTFRGSLFALRAPPLVIV